MRGRQEFIVTPPSFPKQAGACVIAVGALLLTPSGGHAEHSHALWRVVHDLCLPDRALTGLPAPCLAIDARAGYAVVPDPKKYAHLLLVPTRRLTGIEDPALLKAGTLNYWRLAWTARSYLETRLKRPLPRQAVGLAVNAIAGRSQEQLHIHISCIRPEVSQALASAANRISSHWTSQSVLGWRWRVRSLSAGGLNASDPFQLVSQDEGRARMDMGAQTLVLVGAHLPDGDGFYLLSRATNPAADDPGHGEFLLDERCAAVDAT